MNNNTTKILTIVILVLIFMLSAFGIYKYFSFKASVSPEIDGGDTSTTSTFPQSQDTIVEAGDSNITSQKEKPRNNFISSNNSATSSNIVGLTVKIISDKAVSGSYFIEKQVLGEKEPKPYLRYTERESGHLFEIAHNENIPQKLSNTTITRVYESYYNNLGDNLLYRRLDENNTVQNILSRLEQTPVSTSTDNILTSNVGKLSQSVLQPDIREVALSPNRDKVFYLTAVGDDFIGTIENFGGKKTGKKQVFNSPLSEWLVQWPKNNMLFFNTKPSSGIPGYLYSVDIDKQDFTKIMGNVNGLTTNVSPDLKKLIYSESTGGWVKTYLYDPSKKEDYLIPLATLPEKCVWGGIEKDLLYCAVPIDPANNQYPDAWYQGIESFSDEIWLLNTATGQTNIIANKDNLEGGAGIDATNLQLSPKEDYLSLINKKDQSLWLIKVK